VNVDHRLAFPIEVLLTAMECSFAGIGFIASAGAELFAACNCRLQQATAKRPASKNDAAAKEAHPTQLVADVIALPRKRKHER
jgi:hypothetical protein